MIDKKKIITSQWESQQILKSQLMKAFDPIPNLKTLQEASNENLEELINMAESFLFFMSDEKHQKFRKVLAKPMSMKSFESYQAEIQKSIDQALEGFMQESQPDLVKHFTNPLYVKLLNNVFGLQIEDEVSFLQDVATTLRITEPMLSLRELKQLQSTFLKLKEMIKKHLLEDSSSGFIKDIYESGKEVLNQEELLTLILTLVISSKTTSESLVCILCEYGKLDNKMQKKMLSSEWLSKNVDHLVRFCASTKYLTRVAAESVTFGELHIEKGEQIFIDIAKVNRDASFYGANTAFDEDPSPKRSHAGFGGSPRTCPGIHMGKLVIMLAVPKFFSKVVSLECEEDEIIYQASTSARRPMNCPIVIETMKTNEEING